MTKILVTGSSGLIGRQVTKDLLRKKIDVYSGYNIVKPEFGMPIEMDVSKKDMILDVLQRIKPDIIFHLAAMTDVDLCETKKELAMRVNTESTKVLAEEAKKQNIFLVYMSTDYVFDGTKSLKKENDIPNPLNVYGKTKLDGEIALREINPPHVIIRTSTPFGTHPKKKSFPLWVKENLESNKETPALIDQFTSPTFVPNLSNMLIEVTEKKISGIIHLTGATRISRFQVAEIIAERLDLDKTLLKPTKIEHMNWIAQRPKDSSLDISKANEILDEKPQEIKYSLDLLINEIKNNV